MADGVDKLKQLLFQQEAATLVDLEHRIARVAEAEEHARTQILESLRQLETVRELGAEGRRLQAELERRLGDLNRRTGTPEALKLSVAEVIDDVIVEARKTKHDDLSRALAPMLVRTIKAELKNNQAEMVEALYPITGQLVRSYVASAMRDLTKRMNRGIQTSGFMLQLRSLLSGYSKAELRLAETQRLEVEELYLVRRGSGELLVRFPDSPYRTDADVHMTGVLTAINDFAAHAFQSDGGNLRSFDVDDFTLFLRASPAYLLAAKCRGVAAPGVEGLLDSELLAALPQLHELDDGGLKLAVPARLLADLKTRVESGIADKHEELSRAGLPFNPLRAMAAAALLALLAGGGWYAWTVWEVEQTRQAAERAVAASEAMRGYPVTVEVGRRGRSIAVLGLAPGSAAKSELMSRFETELPGVVIADKGLATLPGPAPDLMPTIAAIRSEVDDAETSLRREIGALERQTARAAAVRSLERAQLRLEAALPDIAALASLQEPSRRSVVDNLQSAVETALAGIEAQSRTLGVRTADAALDARAGEALGSATAQLRMAAQELSGLIGQRPASQDAGAGAPRSGGRILDAAEAAALAAERVATLSAATLQAASIRLPEPPRIPAPTALERLRAYASRNAVFFANNEDYRDAATASRVIAEVARLALEAGVLVRVVGYTDERGGQSRNNQLAQARADKIAQALAAHGLPRQRVIAVGRAIGPDLSPMTGPDSPNRRAEFEIGFEGEPVAEP